MAQQLLESDSVELKFAFQVYHCYDGLVYTEVCALIADLENPTISDTNVVHSLELRAGIWPDK